MEALSDKQIKQMRDAFLLFDKDGDGVVTTEEITSILTSMGKDTEEEMVKKVIAPFDADGRYILSQCSLQLFFYMSHLVPQPVSYWDRS